MVSPFYKRGNWGTEKLNNLPKVTQLESSRATIQVRPSDSGSLAFISCTLWPPVQCRWGNQRLSSLGWLVGGPLFTYSLILQICAEWPQTPGSVPDALKRDRAAGSLGFTSWTPGPLPGAEPRCRARARGASGCTWAAGLSVPVLTRALSSCLLKVAWWVPWMRCWIPTPGSLRFEFCSRSPAPRCILP